MYTKDKRIYADAGKYLKNGLTVGISMEIEMLDGIEEIDVDLNDLNIRRSGEYTIAVCSGEKVSYLIPSSPTFDSVKKTVLSHRFSEEEQLSIVVNKEFSDEGREDYERLQAWSDFAEKVTKAICPLIGIPIVETLESVRKEMLKTITEYDVSPAVNSFVYDGDEMWLDKATRVGLMNSTTILKAAGEEMTTLWLGNKSYTVPCDTVIQLLSAIEVYALECYNVTAEHKAKVSEMTDIQAIKNYDYTADYPEHLVF